MTKTNKETILTGLLLLAFGMIIINGAYKPAMAEMELMEWESVKFSKKPEIVISKNTVCKTPIVYAYNDLIPKEEIIKEIEQQSKEFRLDSQFMINLADCESTLNNLAKNPNSTAVGVYQFLIKTWEETESWKKYRKARTDYKANIREAMIDIANGEEFRWKQCLTI